MLLLAILQAPAAVAAKTAEYSGAKPRTPPVSTSSTADPQGDASSSYRNRQRQLPAITSAPHITVANPPAHANGLDLAGASHLGGQSGARHSGIRGHHDGAFPAEKD